MKKVIAKEVNPDHVDFSFYTEFCIDGCYGYYVPNIIRWQEGKTLRKYLAECYGCKPEELEIHLYDSEDVATRYKIMD